MCSLIFDFYKVSGNCLSHVRYQKWYYKRGLEGTTQSYMLEVVFIIVRRKVMVFNDTFNNISVTSWRSAFFCGEEMGVPVENHRPAASHWQTLYHKKLYRVHLELTTLVMISTDSTRSCYSNYNTIMTTTAPVIIWKTCLERHACQSCIAHSLIIPLYYFIDITRTLRRSHRGYLYNC